MDESDSVNDWGWTYKKPKKLHTFIENRVEEIMDYNS